MENSLANSNTTLFEYAVYSILYILLFSAYAAAADMSAIENIPLYSDVLKDNKSIWVEPHHPEVKGIALSAGGGAVYILQGGYSNMRKPYALMPVVMGELYSPPRIPIVSRLAFTGTVTTYRGHYFAKKELPPSYFYGFLEIKLPLEWESAGHISPVYLGYVKQSQGLRSVITDTVSYRGEITLRANDTVYFSDSRDELQLSVNTPITREDAPYSFSRFGLYFSQLTRPRYAIVKGNSFILNVNEWDAGLFYKVSKPAFFPGFAVGLELNLGFGKQNLLENRAGLTDADFDSKAVQMALKAMLELKYRRDITENISMTLLAGYRIHSLDTLKSLPEDKGRFDNSGSSLGQIGLTLTGAY